MRIIVAVGARPNVVKVGPLLPELERAGLAFDVAFTGSREVGHPDDTGADASFYGVDLVRPRWFLDAGASTCAARTGPAMIAFEDLFAAERPDAVLVVGDVSATLAAAVSAAKAGIPVVHLDAGLRCGDLRVPEEINRVLVSRITAMHLTSTEQALENLEDEGVEPERIHFVGNMLAESVIKHLDEIVALDVCTTHQVKPGAFVLACFHRPENLGSGERLAGILGGLGMCGLPVVLPDTNGFRDALEAAGLAVPGNVDVVDAVPYRAMLALQRDACAVITDSSGVQEESCTICTPCVTVRECTEQVATVDAGANVLVDAAPEAIAAAIGRASRHKGSWAVPKRWDRAVSDRVVRALKRGIIPLR